MLLFGDYHTHTINSKRYHAKGTILQNVIAGRDRGLKEIAITDHGFDHLLYAVKRKRFDKIKEQVELAKKIVGIKVYLGVEANIKGKDGEIDITKQDLDKLDILLVGHHRFVKPTKFSDIFTYFLPNLFGSEKHASKKRIIRNTQTIINVLKNYPVDILTHLGASMPVDVLEVAKVAVKTGTKIELNEKRLLFTKQEIDAMVNMGVDFIISSDAHKPTNVGQVEKVFNFIIKNNIPEERICNLNKVPKFKKEIK